jgi:uncharacterized protein (DUF2062 family)
VKYFSKLKDIIIRFSKKGLSPQEIALAIAVGTFIAFIPIMGTHTLTAFALSYPFQLFISAEVGSLILDGDFLEITFSHNINYLEHYIWPIIVGSLVLGIIVASLSYILIKNILHKRSRLPA